MKKILSIKGMHCASCEILLKEAIEELGVKVVSANHKKGEVIVDLQNENKMDAIKNAVQEEGYTLS